MHLKLPVYTASAALVMLSAVKAGAWFSAAAETSDVSVAAADIGVSSGEGGFMLDLSGYEDHILAFAESERIEVMLGTEYQGSVKAYLIPCIRVDASGLTGGDVIKTMLYDRDNRLMSEGSIKPEGSTDPASGTGSSVLYSDPLLMDPGESIRYKLVLELEKLSADSFPEFTFDAGLSVAQAAGNDELMSEHISACEKYHMISDDAGSAVNGFKVHYDMTSAVDADGRLYGNKKRKYHRICIRPENAEPDPDISAYTWYRLCESGYTELLRTENGELRLLIPDTDGNEKLRYELSGRAGTVCSPVYSLSTGGKLHITAEEYNGGPMSCETDHI